MNILISQQNTNTNQNLISSDILNTKIKGDYIIKTNQNIIDNKSELRLVSLMKSKQCTVLENGTRPEEIMYFLCNCDPNLMEVICEYCANNCHKGSEHKIVEKYYAFKTCQCGLKNHKIEEVNKIYSSKCYYHELSIVGKTNLYFEGDINGTIICMFCYNLCRSSEYYGNENFTPKIYQFNDNNTQFPTCDCPNKDHSYLKFAPEKWSELAENKTTIFNFGNLKPIQIINLIFLSQESFNNVFKSFVDYFKELKNGILNQGEWEFDKNIHLTNYFRCLKVLSNFGDLSSSIYYFTEKLTKFFPDFILYIFIHNYLSDSVGLWNFLNVYLKAYKKIIILPYLSRFARFKHFDFQNMSPLQRLSIILNIHSSPFLIEFKDKYIYKENNIIDLLILGFDKIIKLKFTSIDALECLINILSLLETFSELYFFTNEQIMRFCNITEKIFSVLIEFKKKNENKLKNLRNKEYVLLLNVITCLLNFPNSYNDFIILKHIRSKKKEILAKDLQEIKFLHSFNEIGKSIAKSTINIIYFITKDNKNLEDKEDIDSILAKKIINNATQLITLFLIEDDYFVVGLQRNIDQDNSIYIKLINNNNNCITTDNEFFNNLKFYDNTLIESCNKFIVFETNKVDIIEIVKSTINYILVKIKPYNVCEDITNKVKFINRNDDIYSFLNYTKNEIKNDIYLKDDDAIKLVQSSLFNSNVINSIIKCITLIENNSDNIKDINQISEELIIDIFKVLKFFVKNNIDNCLIGASISYLIELQNLPEKYAIQFFSYCDYCFEYLSRCNFEFTYTVNYVESIFNYFKLISKDHVLQYYCLYYLLNLIITIMNKILTSTIHSTILAIRKIIEDLLDQFEIFNYFKEYLVKEACTYINYNNANNRTNEVKINNNSMLDKLNLSGIRNKELSSKILITINNNNSNTPNNNKYLKIDNIELPLLLARKIYIKLLYIINSVFDDNATLTSDDFLSNIISKEEAILILKDKRIDLELRTELIKFYRMIYIDVGISERNIDNYRLAFIAVQNSDDNENLSNNLDSEIFFFLDYLISLSKDNLSNNIDDIVEEDYSDYYVIMNELKLVPYICEQYLNKNNELLLYYYEQAIFLPVKVYLNKFFSQAKKKQGKDFIKIYELIILCLSLKYDIIKNNLLNNQLNKEDKDLINNDVNHDKDNYIDNNNIISSYDLASGFKLNNSILIFSKFNKSNIDKIKKTIEDMINPNFKIFDYINLYKIADNHILSLIKEKKTKDLMDIFGNKEQLTIENTLKQIKEIKELNTSSNNHIHSKLIDLYFRYKHEKLNFNNLSIVKILPEVQIQYDLTVRNILLRYLFYAASIEDHELNVVSKNAYFIIFKLLQNDTENIQKEIELIISSQINYSIVNLFLLVNIFFKNLLSIFLSAYNPSKLEIKNDYETAFNIIKIFKFLSEKGNQYFQGIIINTLKFNYGDSKTQITFFDLLLVILSKMLTLSKWDRQVNEVDSEYYYFYNIYASILELIIEVIQGNSEENFNIMLDSEYIDINSDNSLLDNKKKPGKLCILPQFISVIQKLIFEDSSYSKKIYEIRKQMFEVYLAFLEEPNCPESIQHLIINKINFNQVVNSLKHTLKKYYVYSCINNNNNNTTKHHSQLSNNYLSEENFSNEKDLNYKFILENDINKACGLNQKIIKLDNQQLVNESEVNSLYTKLKITDKIYNFYINSFFNEDNFDNEIEFNFACTLYRYIKLINIKFENSEVKYFVNKYEKKQDVNTTEEYEIEKAKEDVKPTGLINENKNMYYDEYYENYLTLKFFEKITRVVEVQREEQITKVIFTISPDFELLSKESKELFINNIKRNNRFTKLSYLMDHSNYFIGEMKFIKEYNKKMNVIQHIGNKINYKYFMIILFMASIVINIIMLVTLDASFTYELLDNPDETNNRLLQIGNDYHNILDTHSRYGVNSETIKLWKPVYGGISLGFVVLSVLIGTIWCLSKLPLIYHNFKLRHILIDKSEEKKLKFLTKVRLLIVESLLKSKLISSILLYSIFSILGYLKEDGSWAFSFTLLIVINLSTTIETILTALAMRWRSLLAAWCFQLTCMYVYANIGFFFLNKQFTTIIEGKEYNLCRSLVNCMLIFFDFGLRRHGGIGELMPKVSYKHEKALYVSKFFFELSYYLIITVIIMNVVFGIIIDTFRELRLIHNEVEYEKANICLICGAKREELERNKINFITHINSDHNIWSYMHYMLRIKNSDPQDLMSINGYAYEKMDEKSTYWFPKYVLNNENIKEEYNNNDLIDTNNKVQFNDIEEENERIGINENN